MSPSKLKEQFVRMRAQGHTFDHISRRLGKSKQTLVDWSRELREEIANLKAMELEALYERYYLSVRRKIELHGTVLLKLKDELETRDVKDMPTDKLIELSLKLYGLLEAERVEPKFRSSAEIEETKESAFRDWN